MKEQAKVSMQVDVTFSPHELQGRDPGGKSVVVIDTLRATSTMITAFENGCAAFIPVPTVEEARKIARENPEYLLAGERRAVPLEGFHLGNSPRDYCARNVKGKVVVMTTTNGTRTLAGAGGGEEVLIGAFLNLTAVAEHLGRKGRDVLIACAGEKGFFCLEDSVCAGALIAAIEGTGAYLSKTDGANAAKLLYEYYVDNIYGMLLGCDWGQYLEKIGLGRDIRICAQIDSSRLVPVCRKGKIVVER
jgi:2-phosphosulfolactate phosphatase